MIVLPFEKYYLLGYFAAGLALALLIGLVLVVWKTGIGSTTGRTPDRCITRSTRRCRT